MSGEGESHPVSPLGPYVFTDHALGQIGRRGVGRAAVESVLESSQRAGAVRPGRVVVQRIVAMDDPPKRYLVRVVIDTDRHPAEVVTAYRTTKFVKCGGTP